MTLVVACGGRFERSVRDDGQGSSGTASIAGASDRAGSSGSGGSAAMGGVCACGPIACAPGYKAVPSPGACCSSCELDLEACEQQRLSYADFRARVIVEQTTSACTTSEECVLFYDLTGCGVSCGIAIPQAARRGIDDRLYAFAEMSCSPDCPPLPEPSCMQRPPATCVAGRCQ
jgi:hypothetical protein